MRARYHAGSRTYPLYQELLPMLDAAPTLADRIRVITDATKAEFTRTTTTLAGKPVRCALEFPNGDKLNADGASTADCVASLEKKYEAFSLAVGA